MTPTDPTTPSTLRHLECSICGECHAAGELQTVCRACGRALLARYDLDAASEAFRRRRYLERPADMWRYAEVLPVRDPAAVTCLGEGMTPLLAAPRLGRRLGLRRLYVKDEGRNPTGSFKSRGLAAAVSVARELGVREVSVPTAGNAGGAAAAYAARAGMRAHVAMPRDAPATMVDEVRTFGAELELVDGLISDAGRLLARGVAEHGWFDLSTMKEPYRVEGKKTMGYELWEQLGGELPEVIVYPTGGGTGLVGIWKAFAELAEMGLVTPPGPRMIAVQAAGCAPIVRAFEAGVPRAEPWPDAATVAPGLRVPTPFADDLILRTLAESGGRAVAVGDDEIRDAVRELAAVEGIDAAPEAAATLVGLRRLLDDGELDGDPRVVLLATATGLKHPELRPGAGSPAQGSVVLP